MLITVNKQGTRRAEDGKYQVSCSCSVLLVPVVCCVPATDCKQKHCPSYCTWAYKFLLDDNAKSLLMPANVACTHLNRLKQSPLLPPLGDRPTATVHPYWCCIARTVAYSDSLVYCSTLGGTAIAINC